MVRPVVVSSYSPSRSGWFCAAAISARRKRKAPLTAASAKSVSAPVTCARVQPSRSARAMASAAWRLAARSGHVAGWHHRQRGQAPAFAPHPTRRRDRRKNTPPGFGFRARQDAPGKANCRKRQPAGRGLFHLAGRSPARPGIQTCARRARHRKAEGER